jgi:SAM-dependent methyltransferase
MRLGATLSPEARVAATRALGLDRPPKARRGRLEHHYAYFESKWGWSMLNPDMDAVRRRWGDTELCWATDRARKAAGEELAAAYNAHRGRVAQASSLETSVSYGLRNGFLPPPPWSSLMRYEHILEVIRDKEVGQLGGDAVEIGVLIGGGVYQLARLFERLAPERKVIGIDIFATAVDDTLNRQGRTMQDIYDGLLGDYDQREVYDLVVADCRNVVTVAGDSATVEIPTDAIAFAHIDGNHTAEYVRKDFERIWERLVPGGIIAFDDYGGDLPEVTDTVDALRREHADEIADFFKRGEKTGFLQRRR